MDDVTASTTKKKTEEDPLLTYALVAELAGVKIGTVYMWKKRNLMPKPAPETTGRRPVWRKSTIETFLTNTLRREPHL